MKLTMAQMQDFNEKMAVIHEDVRRRENELFGRKRSLPANESAIVFSDLPHAEKLARLAILRSTK